jgi:hypothetical protein
MGNDSFLEMGIDISFVERMSIVLSEETGVSLGMENHFFFFLD